MSSSSEFYIGEQKQEVEILFSDKAKVNSNEKEDNRWKWKRKEKIMTQYVQKSLLGSWYVEIPKDIASTFEDDVLSFFEIMFSSLPANKSKHLIYTQAEQTPFRCSALLVSFSSDCQ